MQLLRDQTAKLQTSVQYVPDAAIIKQKLKRQDTPPFLTWAWLTSDIDKNVRPERVAAENLFAIMEDIDRNLKSRNEICYTRAMEVTLNEWEDRVSNSRLVPRSPSPFGEPSSPLRSIGDLLSEDAVLRVQQSEMYTAIDELATNAKNFVGLFIPCRFQHAVSKKIWGSLSLLLKSATSNFDEDESLKQGYLVRPLDPDFMEEHKIDHPLLTIQDCTTCRDGHIHKSVHDAVHHLKRVHFKYESSLSQLAHLQTTSRHWVRTENQVRNELTNKFQLRLLRICLKYLKVLYARAEKIYSGVSHEGEVDTARYQLPNDLVDCFEATVLFIMIAATSIIAIEEDMRGWQHVPGNSLEEIKTPTLEYALERLAELGQAAQASMTRAEKTLALSDQETNTVSMGAASPELLVSVLVQNLQKRRLLETVDMDVNQLYQKYTSKLQYQINQFPRKRLLRDIHALQEELVVVQHVNTWQQQTFENMIKVLDPQSFQKPTPSRAIMFVSESECLKVGVQLLQSQAVELEALEHRTQYLREQLKQSVEILEEDHGKAILVFTMITTIFLPLSFATSFFGMNTSDIRNTNRSQTFFWAIAIPVTAGIVFSAVLLAYHGDKLYDAVVQVVHEIREKRAMTSEPLLEFRNAWDKSLPVYKVPWKARRRSAFGFKNA
ncbi:hypothetical protein IQ07DRAFT_501866 [Pyrenochaeta sp. DS3sAY3a]|nr:hypothetical protein IQ07DRAFT_501866 [Pyrenochaeta sp. DS3sAY3a]